MFSFIKRLITVTFFVNIFFVVVFGARSGPFKSSLVKVEDCPSRTKPLDPNPPSGMLLEAYNSSSSVKLLKGNITIYRSHRVTKMKAKSYIWDGNKWKVNYLVNNMGCNRVFFPALCAATGVKYDPKTCSFHKGSYIFSNFELNRIQHVWMSTQEYGRVLWRVEVFSAAGSVFCHEIETWIEPAK